MSKASVHFDWHVTLFTVSQSHHCPFVCFGVFWKIRWGSMSLTLPELPDCVLMTLFSNSAKITVDLYNSTIIIIPSIYLHMIIKFTCTLPCTLHVRGRLDTIRVTVAVMLNGQTDKSLCYPGNSALQLFPKVAGKMGMRLPLSVPDTPHNVF